MFLSFKKFEMFPIWKVCCQGYLPYCWVSQFRSWWILIQNQIYPVVTIHCLTDHFVTFPTMESPPDNFSQDCSWNFFQHLCCKLMCLSVPQMEGLLGFVSSQRAIGWKKQMVNEGKAWMHSNKKQCPETNNMWKRFSQFCGWKGRNKALLCRYYKYNVVHSSAGQDSGSSDKPGTATAQLDWFSPI